MKPAWLTDEYASMRFTFVCTTARNDPTSSDSRASTQIDRAPVVAVERQRDTSTRSIAANAAALPADAMNAVTGDGEPWYTSGTHTWNGAAATLKPSPTISRAMPASASVFGFSISTVVCIATTISEMFVEPVAP